MNEFEHDYYYPPQKAGEPALVLCMRCALKIKGIGITKEESLLRYKEKNIVWISENGAKGDGVIILCPDCISKPIENNHFNLIHRQITKALEDEAKWAKLPVKTDLKNMRIVNQEAA